MRGTDALSGWPILGLGTLTALKLLLDSLLRRTWLRQPHLAGEHLLKPERLEAMRQDIVEGGHLATNKGHIRHLRWDDVAIEVQPVLLNVELFLDDLVENIIVLREACSVNHHVCVQLFPVDEHDT